MKESTHTGRAARLAAAASVVAAVPALAQPVGFTRIADSATLIPSGGGATFSNLGAPALDAGSVAFTGDGNSGSVRGLYTNLGGALRRVADNSMIMPGNTVHLSGFGAPSLQGSTIAWFSQGPPFSGNKQVILAEIAGTLTLIANKTQAAPGEASTFNGFGPDPTTYAGDIAFHGFTTLDDGVFFYPATGSPSVIANAATVGPGGLPFDFTGRPALAAGGKLAFVGGQGGLTALYTWDGAAFTRVIGQGDTVPGRNASVVSISDPAYDGASLAFTVTDNVDVFLLSNQPGPLTVIADTQTPAPGGVGNFMQFGFGAVPALDGANLAFGGADSVGTPALYANVGGQLQRLIAAGQSFDGRTVGNVSLGAEGLRQGTLGFAVVFTNGDVGVYTAPLTVCYANCDGSTTSPSLNVLDFACFLNRFAAGDTYANCDGSTTPPVLNVLDFACFLNRFAAGCS